MRMINRGWQYTVYDLGNGRVLKKINSRFVSYLMMLHDSFPYIKHPVWKFPGYFARCRRDAALSMKAVSQTSIESWKLGNPKVLDELSYEQDKMVPLKEYWKAVGLDESQRVIDDFVSLCEFLVANSLVDKNFNIGENFAIDSQGRVILEDLGELYFQTDMIAEQLKKRPWADYDNTHIVPRELRSYFVGRMDEAFFSRRK